MVPTAVIHFRTVCQSYTGKKAEILDAELTDHQAY